MDTIHKLALIKQRMRTIGFNLDTLLQELSRLVDEIIQNDSRMTPADIKEISVYVFGSIIDRITCTYRYIPDYELRMPGEFTDLVCENQVIQLFGKLIAHNEHEGMQFVLDSANTAMNNPSRKNNTFHKLLYSKSLLQLLLRILKDNSHACVIEDWVRVLKFASFCLGHNPNDGSITSSLSQWIDNNTKNRNEFLKKLHEEVDIILEDFLREATRSDGDARLVQMVAAEFGELSLELPQTPATVLHLTCAMCLPKTTKVLLSYPDIDWKTSMTIDRNARQYFQNLSYRVDVQRYINLNPIDVCITTLMWWRDDSIMAVAEILLKSGKIEVGDTCAEVVQYILEHITMGHPDKGDILLSLIVLSARHKSASAQLVANYILLLLKYYALFGDELNQKYSDTLKTLMQSSKISFDREYDTLYMKIGKPTCFQIQNTLTELIPIDGELPIIKDSTAPLPQPPFKLVTNHKEFDPKRKNQDGKNIIHLLIDRLIQFISREVNQHQSYIKEQLKQQGKELTLLPRQMQWMENTLVIIEHVLANQKADVSMRNNQGQAASDMIIGRFMKLEDDHFLLLFMHVIGLLGAHCTATARIISDTLNVLSRVNKKYIARLPPGTMYIGCRDEILSEYLDENSTSLHQKVVQQLTEAQNFDVNHSDDDGRTVAHAAALEHDVAMLKILVKLPHFDPNKQDNLGNTALFYLVESVKNCEEIGGIIKTIQSTHQSGINISLKNAANQTILDKCQANRNEGTKKALEKLLREDFGVISAAQFEEERPSANIPPQDVLLMRMPPDGASSIRVTTANDADINRITSQNQSTDSTYRAAIYTKDLYDMVAPEKGKACIISIPHFNVPWLDGLEGYTKDQEKLQILWQKMGFDVYRPQTVQPHSKTALTMEEINTAVKRFAESLAESDSCAVLCILSHGGDRFVYGRDGKRIFVKHLLEHLNNDNCPNMMDKPKVVIIQACNGDSYDSGSVLAACGAPTQRLPLTVTSAAQAETLPVISDTIVIYPSQPGYVSFVYNTPGEGSVLVKHLVQVFSKYAASEDIYSLLTRINRAVSDETFQMTQRDGSKTDFKQMPEFRSSLRKLLYFFPREKPDDNETNVKTVE